MVCVCVLYIYIYIIYIFILYLNLVSRCLWSHSYETARTIFMIFLSIYFVGMRIGRKVYLLPLGDLNVPVQKAFLYSFDKNLFCIVFRFEIKKIPILQIFTLLPPPHFYRDFSISVWTISK